MPKPVKPAKRRQKKYRPRDVLLNPVAVAIEGQSLAGLSHPDAIIRTRILNHEALEEIRQGRGTYQTFNALTNAMNMAMGLCLVGIGQEHQEDIGLALDAMHDMAHRWQDKGSMAFTGVELNAVREGLDLHDQQLDYATVKELERARAIVHSTIINKRARTLKRPPQTTPPHEISPG